MSEETLTVRQALVQADIRAQIARDLRDRVGGRQLMEEMKAEAERRYAAIEAATEGIRFDMDGNLLPREEPQVKVNLKPWDMKSYAPWLSGLKGGDPVMVYEGGSYPIGQLGKVVASFTHTVRISIRDTEISFNRHRGEEEFVSEFPRRIGPMPGEPPQEDARRKWLDSLEVGDPVQEVSEYGSPFDGESCVRSSDAASFTVSNSCGGSGRYNAITGRNPAGWRIEPVEEGK